MSPTPGMVIPNLGARNASTTFSAPIGGLNTRDSLANMPETDSPILVNWIPDVGGLKVRKGYLQWSTVAAGAKPVRTIFGYFGNSSVFVAPSDIAPPSVASGDLYAVTDTAIYFTGARGAVPTVAQALSGTANAGYCQTTMFTNAAGSWLILCSETDGYYYYNGGAWNKITLGVGANQVSVVDPTTFVQPCSFKRRLWFVQRNTSKAAYLAADAVTGAAASFDFGPQFRKGGDLAFLANWTIDAGEGVDDFLVAVSEMGDVLVYKGTDPTSATTFGLVGAWSIGPVPVGRRGYCQFGGDLALLSVEGLFPLSMVTRGGSDILLAAGKEYSSKIRPAISVDLRQSFTTRGWDVALHPSERLLIVNVPTYLGITKKQYAMNTSLMAWTTFDGIPINCMGSAGQMLFAGTTDGRVLMLNFGDQDEVPYGGAIGNAINGVVAFPFSYFGAPSKEKHFLLGRLSFLSQLKPDVTFDISVNFSYENQAQPISVAPTSITSVWDLGLFDLALWDGVSGYNAVWWADWESVEGLGFSGAAICRSVTYVSTTLVAADVVYEVARGL